MNSLKSLLIVIRYKAFYFAPAIFIFLSFKIHFLIPLRLNWIWCIVKVNFPLYFSFWYRIVIQRMLIIIRSEFVLIYFLRWVFEYLLPVEFTMLFLLVVKCIHFCLETRVYIFIWAPVLVYGLEDFQMLHIESNLLFPRLSCCWHII